jgi:hypothetical protein
MHELLKNLNLDRWYKPSLAIGFVLIVLALTVDTKWLSNQQAGLAGTGFFFIGLGAWKNVKHKVEFTRNPAGYAQYSVTEPDAIGIIFWLIGLLSFGWFFKLLFF